MTIAALIDKQDTFEIIRDQIGAILVTEVASQMVLATAAGKDANDWKIRVFSERSNPWDDFNDNDTTPLVNVSFDNSNFALNKSNISERQASETVYNIDCYGYGVSKNNVAGGHLPGDEQAAKNVQKTIRLVRNILMAAEYTYLGLRGTVWQRFPQSITVFQPQLDGRQIPHIVGARIAFSVSFNEFSPQVEPVVLELLSVDVLRAENGELILEADYNYT
jgi:hypothetical protein